MPFNVTRNQEWLDRASDSRYPLISGTSATDTSGAFVLPNDLLVGLLLAVPIDLRISPVSVWISRIVVSPHFLQLQLSAKINEVDTLIARADVALAAARASIESPLGYAQATLEGVAPYADLKGQIQLGRLDNLDRQPVGAFDFAYEATAIDPDCIRPQLRQISAIEAEIATDQFARLTGVVRLRPGSNMRLRVVTENGEPVVYFDALDANGLNDDLECDEGTQSQPIYRINGIPGDAQRNFQLSGSRCLEISPATFGAALRNGCSEPCAGCTEVAPLAARVKAIEGELPAFTNFIANLSAQLTRMLVATDLSTAVTECQTLGGDIAP